MEAVVVPAMSTGGEQMGRLPVPSLRLVQPPAQTGILRKLRPTKIRSGVRRRWFLHQMARLPLAAPAEPLVEAGSAYGAWIVPSNVEPDWTCYCIGIGGDFSLEQHLLETGATVRSVDPHEPFVQDARTGLRAFDRFSAHYGAIADHTGTVTMQAHHEAISSSLSAAHLYDSKDTCEVPALTLSSLLNECGDQRIDLLKLDVEGLEYDLIPKIDLRGLGVRVFATQFHHNRSARDARRIIHHLESLGYRHVAQRPVCKLTFLHQQR